MKDVTVPPAPRPITDAPKVSRTRAKRLFNMHKAEIIERTNTTKVQAQALADEVQRLRAQLVTSGAIIESLVHRYGAQAFGIEELMASNRERRLLIEQSSENTLTVKLADVPCVSDTDQAH